LNSEGFIHSPQPDKIFANLLKNWNLVVADEQNQCPKEIFNWIQKNVQITEVNIKVVSWGMGKGDAKFKGFIGKVVMSVTAPNKEYEAWLYILARFGEYASTGAQRSVGFGHYKIEKIRFSNAEQSL
jgi:CRISPR/Cas system endoribonuclease Cas6 (RAMP superfamily)